MMTGCSYLSVVHHVVRSAIIMLTEIDLGDMVKTGARGKYSRESSLIDCEWWCALASFRMISSAKVG